MAFRRGKSAFLVYIMNNYCSGDRAWSAYRSKRLLPWDESVQGSTIITANDEGFAVMNARVRLWLHNWCLVQGMTIEAPDFRKHSCRRTYSECLWREYQTWCGENPTRQLSTKQESLEVIRGIPSL